MSDICLSREASFIDVTIDILSLKYYFVSFRNVGIYQEAATKRIYSDLLSALGSKQLMVTTIYNIRGGFQTTCVEGSLD